MRLSRSVNRTTAALIPSSDVPDISPTYTPSLRDSAFPAILSDRWWLAIDHAPDHAAVLGQLLLGLLARDAKERHHDRGLDASAGGLEHLLRGLSIETGNLHHDPMAAIDELVVRRPEIDHQVAEGLAEADHRAGGDRVQDQLRRRARLHARGS